MKKVNAPSILVIILLLFPVFTGLGVKQLPEDINKIFSVNSLSSNDCHMCFHWQLLIENQFPKIGIYVDFSNYTSWDAISTRTWNYPYIDYDYIPTYDEGGYDILFCAFKWDLDPDLVGLFDSAGSSSPFVGGMNFYQYCNPEYDNVLNHYLTELNQTQKTEYFYDLQSILFEDLPAISILYGNAVYGKRTSVTGVDWDLLYKDSQRPELWKDTDDQNLTYLSVWDLEAQNIYRSKKDPNYSSSGKIDSQWMNAVYGRLFQRRQTSHYWEPEITLNYTVSSDLLNFSINIDPNAKFSDGSSVLAEDVEYSYRLHLTPLVNSTKYSDLNNWFSSNHSIEAIDTYKLNFNFSRFCYSPLKILSEGILDKSEVEPLISTYGYTIFNEVPLTGNVTNSLIKSCGPFELNHYEPLNNNTVKLLPNVFWNNLTSSGGNNPFLKELYFTTEYGVYEAIDALKLGSAEIMDAWYNPSYTFLTSDPYVNYEIAKTGSQAEMSINMKHPVMGTGELTPLGTPEAAKVVRKAISHTIPRDLIVEQHYDSVYTSPGTSPIPDACVDYDTSLQHHEYNIPLAIDLLESIGYDVRKEPTTKTSFMILLSMTIGLAVIGIRKRRKK